MTLVEKVLPQPANDDEMQRTRAIRLLLARKNIALAVSPRMQKRSERPWYPLSSAQQGLWYMDQLRLGEGSYHIPIALELHGVLHPKSLQDALNVITERHETLRTHYRMENGQGVQIVMPFEARSLPLIDLEGVSEAERRSEVARLTEQEALRQFDLGRDPPFRFMLIRSSDREHVIVMTLHHLSGDGWSMGVLAAEMVEVHSALLSCRAPALAPLPIQYADFACWEEEQMQDKQRRMDLDYWKRKFDDRAPVFSLPTDRRRSGRRGPACRVDLSLSAELYEGLQRIARTQDATPFMVVAAAYFVLLRHCSGQCGVMIGTDLAERPLIETEGLIGYFIKRLLLKIDLDESADLRSLIGTVRTTTLEALSHQCAPYHELIQAIDSRRLPQDGDITPAVMVYDNTPSPRMDAFPLRIRAVPSEYNGAKYDLALVLRKTDVLSGYMEYDSDLFERRTIERMAELLSIALKSICLQCDARLADVLAELSNEDRAIQSRHRQSRRQTNAGRLQATVGGAAAQL